MASMRCLVFTLQIIGVRPRSENPAHPLCLRFLRPTRLLFLTRCGKCQSLYSNHTFTTLIDRFTSQRQALFWF